MVSRLSRVLVGPSNPYPLALFRIAFFGGLALHFGPSFVYLGENYATDAFRSHEWNETLYALLPQLPPAVITALAIVTALAFAAGMLGFYTRAAAAIAGLGCYTFASFNGLPTQTLALSTAWAIFFILVIFGGGDGALSLRKRFFGTPSEPGAKTTRLLIVAQVMIGFVFAGIEKLTAGWATHNEMHIVFGYPAGFMLRPWAVAHPLLTTEWFGWLATYGTLAVELGVPFLVLFKRLRLPTIAVYQLFFAGIICSLEVPPLFYCLYAGGGLLAIGDNWWNRITGYSPVGAPPNTSGNSDFSISK